MHHVWRGDHGAQCVVWVGYCPALLQPESALPHPSVLRLGKVCVCGKTFHSLFWLFPYSFCRRHPHVGRTADGGRTRSLLSRVRGCRDRVTWRNKVKVASVVSCKPHWAKGYGGEGTRKSQPSRETSWGGCCIKSTPSPMWCLGPQKETPLASSPGLATRLGCDLRGVMSPTLG